MTDYSKGSYVVVIARSLVRLREWPDGAVELGPSQAGVERRDGRVREAGSVALALIKRVLLLWCGYGRAWCARRGDGALVEHGLLQLLRVLPHDGLVGAGRDADHDAASQDAVGATDRLLGLQPEMTKNG